MRRVLTVLALVAMIVPALAAQPAGGQMPDPKQMSGIPRPDGEIPAGTVTVRVIRGSLANNLPGHPVELVGEGPVSGKTNDEGRAEFRGLKIGARLKAVTTVDGERLESQEFTVPSNAGVRIMLVATDPGAAQRTQEDQQLA